MPLQVVRAIYQGGTLIFAQPEFTPQDGTEVIMTYLAEGGAGEKRPGDSLQALRGRGKGERLVERLLESRREDKELDESRHRLVRA